MLRCRIEHKNSFSITLLPAVAVYEFLTLSYIGPALWSLPRRTAAYALGLDYERDHDTNRQSGLMNFYRPLSGMLIFGRSIRAK